MNNPRSHGSGFLLSLSLWPLSIFSIIIIILFIYLFIYLLLLLLLLLLSAVVSTAEVVVVIVVVVFIYLLRRLINFVGYPAILALEVTKRQTQLPSLLTVCQSWCTLH